MTGCDRLAGQEPLEIRAKESQQAIGLTLPQGARTVFVHRMRGIDDAAQVIAVMPVADWHALERRIEATVRDVPPPSIEGTAHLGTDHDGWTPGKQPHLSARQVPWRDGTQYLNIGAAPDGPGMVRVFIFWFET